MCAKNFIKKWFTCLLFLMLFNPAQSQVAPNKYWIQFTDKDNSEYSLTQPEEFLSSRAIERRNRYNIPLTNEDLPVNQTYIDSINKMGFKILNRSKWLNAITVYTTNSILIDTIENISFVKTRQKVRSFKSFIEEKDYKIISSGVKSESNYGYAEDQISIHNGQVLHQEGHQGESMLIAIIDAGFFHADILPAFTNTYNNNQVIATKDFVDPGNNVYEEHTHGMKVFSIIAGNYPNKFIGTAPKAQFILLRSEESSSEYSIEEDNWIAAAEFADSLGTDVINTSLGYSEFDDPEQNYTYADMNGNTAKITIGADIAAKKGILVVVSAGNSGNDPWQYISAPADGDSVLTVGAIDRDGNYVSFSSTGPTYDNRIKPDVSALGYQTALQLSNGTFGKGNGTSFAAPVIAGLAACYWQKYPEYNNYEIIEKIRSASGDFNNPNNLTGYGIPNFSKILNTDHNNLAKEINIYPIPFSEYITINNLNDEKNYKLRLIDISGKILLQSSTIKNRTTYTLKGLSDLNSGIYIIQISDENGICHYKITK